MKKICLFLAFLIAMSSSITLQDVKTLVKNSIVVHDSLDVRMTTEITLSGKVTKTESQAISKGSDKLWMEIQTPLGTQRIIKNGNRVQVTDFNGKKTVMKDLPLVNTSQVNQMISLLDSGIYASPVLKSNGVIELISKQGIVGVLQRIVHVDQKTGYILYFEDHFLDGKITKTKISYDPAFHKKYPKSIQIEVSVGANVSIIKLTVNKVSSSVMVPDGVFSF